MSNTTKYYTPKRIEKLNAELSQAVEDFEFLITCRLSNQSFGKYLDTLLEDELVHLADTCIKFNERFEYHLKEKKNYRGV